LAIVGVGQAPGERVRFGYGSLRQGALQNLGLRGRSADDQVGREDLGLD